MVDMSSWEERPVGTPVADWQPGDPLYGRGYERREQSVSWARPMVELLPTDVGDPDGNYHSARWPEPHDRHEIVTPNIDRQEVTRHG